jgi:hypothetical protein
MNVEHHTKMTWSYAMRFFKEIARKVLYNPLFGLVFWLTLIYGVTSLTTNPILGMLLFFGMVGAATTNWVEVYLFWVRRFKK